MYSLPCPPFVCVPPSGTQLWSHDVGGAWVKEDVNIGGGIVMCWFGWCPGLGFGFGFGFGFGVWILNGLGFSKWVTVPTLLSHVTSSSSYSISSEVKAGSSEVRRFPGIGFSSCAVPTFSHVQGILNGGHESSFQNVPERSSVLERFQVQVRRGEKQRFRVRIVRRCTECVRLY